MGKKKNTKTGLFLGIIIFGSLGVFLLFPWVQSIRMVHAGKTWSSVSGTVVSSGVKQVLDSTDKKGRKNFSYRAIVKYSYKVEGQNYISSRITFGDYGTNTPGHGASIVANYPEGKRVRVYYNPDAPMHSVLERRTGVGNIIPILVGILLLLVSFLMLGALIHKLLTAN